MFLKPTSRIRLLCVIVLFCLPFSSCSFEAAPKTPDPESSKFSYTEFSVEVNDKTELLDDADEILLTEETSIPLEKISAADEVWLRAEEIDGLRPALVARLMQLNPGTGFRLVNPDAETQEERYEHFSGGDGIFLFDWNLDGYPELIECYGGKTDLFCIYDLKTGEERSCNLCGFPVLLYDLSAGEYGVYGFGGAYFGWATYFYETSKAVSPDADGKILQTILSYRKEALNLYEDEAGMHSDSAAFFFEEDTQVSMDEWLNAHRSFCATHRLVEEADYDVVWWKNICDENDTPETWASKAADALFAINNRFLQIE